MRMLRAVFFCFFALMFFQRAEAQDLAINGGAIEVLGTDGTHFGVYPYVGASMSFALADGDLLLIPGLAVEYSPEFNRWGGVATFVADLPLSRNLGADMVLNLIHDQSGGDFGEAAYFLGAGPGVSFLFDRWAVSPFVAVFRGLNVPGWSVVPGLNVSRAL